VCLKNHCAVLNAPLCGILRYKAERPAQAFSKHTLGTASLLKR